VRVIGWLLVGILGIAPLSGCDQKGTTGTDDDGLKVDITLTDAEIEEIHELVEKVKRKQAQITEEAGSLEDKISRLGKEENWSRPNRVKIRDLSAAVAKRYQELEALYSKDVLWKVMVYDAEVAAVIDETLKKIRLERDLYLTIRDIQDLRITVMDSREIPTPAPVVARGPVVRDLDEGGVIRGVVRDALTGRAVGGATVGFREPRETDYFERKETDSEGRYQSSPLRPGSYEVDVIRDGYVRSRGSQVAVTQGRIAQENTALTAPLGRGVYRITMSWTEGKAGAVRDVDSYLSIPGVADPLGFRLKAREYNGSHLDLDDVDWGGPETVTIREVKSGTYSYYVNNFSDRPSPSALGNSDIRVKVYFEGSMVGEYKVPPGTGRTYELFRIVDGRLQNVQRFNDSLRVY